MFYSPSWRLFDFSGISRVEDPAAVSDAFECDAQMCQAIMSKHHSFLEGQSLPKQTLVMLMLELIMLYPLFAQYSYSELRGVISSGILKPYLKADQDLQLIKMVRVIIFEESLPGGIEKLITKMIKLWYKPMETGRAMNQPSLLQLSTI